MRIVKDEYNPLKFKVISIGGRIKKTGTYKDCKDYIKQENNW